MRGISITRGAIAEMADYYLLTLRKIPMKLGVKSLESFVRLVSSTLQATIDETNTKKVKLFKKQHLTNCLRDSWRHESENCPANKFTGRDGIEMHWVFAKRKCCLPKG